MECLTSEQTPSDLATRNAHYKLDFVDLISQSQMDSAAAHSKMEMGQHNGTQEGPVVQAARLSSHNSMSHSMTVLVFLS